MVLEVAMGEDGVCVEGCEEEEVYDEGLEEEASDRDMIGLEFEEDDEEEHDLFSRFSHDKDSST